MNMQQTDREQFLENRRKGIGGSDAGAILGLSPYKTPVDVYLEKLGLVTDDADNDATYWGTVLEDTIAQEYARRTNAKIMRRNTHFQHPDMPFMMANIDRWVVGQRKLLECKTAGQYMSDKWGPSGTDQVPDEYLTQCMHYMIVLDVLVCDLAVLIGGRDFRMYTIPFDRELADIIIANEESFWRQHVLAQVPPPPRTIEDITALYPRDNGNSIVGTPEIVNLTMELKGIKASIKAMKERQESHEKAIKEFIGDRSTLLDLNNEVLATWKKAKDSREFDKEACEKVHPEIIKQFTIDKPGSRRFLIK